MSENSEKNSENNTNNENNNNNNTRSEILELFVGAVPDELLSTKSKLFLEERRNVENILFRLEKLKCELSRENSNTCLKGIPYGFSALEDNDKNYYEEKASEAFRKVRDFDNLLSLIDTDVLCDKYKISPRTLESIKRSARAF